MTQPREHRHDIHPRMCQSFGVISDILWREALDLRQPVGSCTRTGCGGLMRPLAPEERNRRMFYPARCSTCGREVEGQGPRVPKEAKS